MHAMPVLRDGPSHVPQVATTLILFLLNLAVLYRHLAVLVLLPPPPPTPPQTSLHHLPPASPFPSFFPIYPTHSCERGQFFLNIWMPFLSDPPSPIIPLVLTPLAQLYHAAVPPPRDKSAARGHLHVHHLAHLRVASRRGTITMTIVLHPHAIRCPVLAEGAVRVPFAVVRSIALHETSGADRGYAAARLWVRTT